MPERRQVSITPGDHPIQLFQSFGCNAPRGPLQPQIHRMINIGQRPGVQHTCEMRARAESMLREDALARRPTWPITKASRGIPNRALA